MLVRDAPLSLTSEEVGGKSIGFFALVILVEGDVLTCSTLCCLTLRKVLVEVMWRPVTKFNTFKKTKH